MYIQVYRGDGFDASICVARPQYYQHTCATARPHAGPQFTCFTGTKASKLSTLTSPTHLCYSSTPRRCQYLYFCTYWYKSTNTDTCALKYHQHTCAYTSTPRSGSCSSCEVRTRCCVPKTRSFASSSASRSMKRCTTRMFVVYYIIRVLVVIRWYIALALSREKKIC